MSEVTSRRVVLQPSGVEVIFAWFQRVISGYCLLFGILYWIKLIGFYPGPLWRFDLMPVHWQVAAAKGKNTASTTAATCQCTGIRSKRHSGPG